MEEGREREQPVEEKPRQDVEPADVARVARSVPAPSPARGALTRRARIVLIRARRVSCVYDPHP